MKQKQCKKYVAPTMEEFTMEEVPIMSVSGQNESYQNAISTRRRGRYQDDEE